jgi:hypothetical protein
MPLRLSPPVVVISSSALYLLFAQSQLKILLLENEFVEQFMPVYERYPAKPATPALHDERRLALKACSEIKKAHCITTNIDAITIPKRLFFMRPFLCFVTTTSRLRRLRSR